MTIQIRTWRCPSRVVSDSTCACQGWHAQLAEDPGVSVNVPTDDGAIGRLVTENADRLGLSIQHGPGVLEIPHQRRQPR